LTRQPIGAIALRSSSASYAQGGPYSFTRTPFPVWLSIRSLSRCLVDQSRLARALQLLLRVRTIGVRL